MKIMEIKIDSHGLAGRGIPKVMKTRGENFEWERGNSIGFPAGRLREEAGAEGFIVGELRESAVRAGVAIGRLERQFHRQR